jgi:hypothetical protein
LLDLFPDPRNQIHIPPDNTRSEWIIRTC